MGSAASGGVALSFTGLPSSGQFVYFAISDIESASDIAPRDFLLKSLTDARAGTY